MKINNIHDIIYPKNGEQVVFVTGATGQDGSLMIDYLLRETSASVVAGVRRLSVDNHINISHLKESDRFQLVNFDLTDSHSIYKIMEHVKPDYFINFAAQSFVASSWDFAKQTWETNSTSVLDILEAIKRFKPSCRFYNAGSSEEFGNVVYEPQDEKHPARPRSPYGASKAAARTIMKVYRESYDLYAVQGWLFNHEGPRRGKEFVTRKIAHGVAKIYDQIVNEDGIPTPIELGNVDAQRDWSDAEDMVDAVWRMLNQEKYSRKGLGGGTWPRNDLNFTAKQLSVLIKDYVVSNDVNHSIREFVEKSFNVLGIEGEWKGEGIDMEFVYVSGPKESTLKGTTLVKINPKFYRPAEVEVLRGNSTQIRNDLGWNPKVSFDTLVEKMITSEVSKL